MSMLTLPRLADGPISCAIGTFFFYRGPKRWANADHRYGFAAECALKAVMLGLGARPDSRGIPEGKREHIDLFWDTFIDFANNRQTVSLANMLQGQSPFDDWRAEQRYAKRSGFQIQRVDQHRQAARKAMSVLEKCRENGIAP